MNRNRASLFLPEFPTGDILRNNIIRHVIVMTVVCSIFCGCANSTLRVRESLNTINRGADSGARTPASTAPSDSVDREAHRQGLATQTSSDFSRPSVTTAGAGQVRPLLSWAHAGKTENSRFELKRIRNGNYRTLIVGSLRGFDPAARAIMDQLAEQLAQDAPIMGGFDCLLVRTANPDGAKHRSVTTSNGLELRNAFPMTQKFRLFDNRNLPSEVVFLARLLQQFQPQRVIVVGQSDHTGGGIVYSGDMKDTARRFAEAVDLPDYSLARRELDRSFENFVANSGMDVISVQLPGSTTVESAWSRFGIWLPALLATNSEPLAEKADSTGVARR